MSLTTDVITPWRAGSLLTAYNVAFAAAALPQLDTAFGIQPAETLLAEPTVTKLPVMAAFVTERRRVDYFTRQNLSIRVVVRVRLAIGSSDPIAIHDVAGTYCDCVRAVATTTFGETLALFRWLADDMVGFIYNPAEHTPTQTVTSDFEFVVPRLGTTV